MKAAPWRPPAELGRSFAQRVADIRREAFAILVRRGQHDAWCAYLAGGRPCTCGLIDDIERLRP